MKYRRFRRRNNKTAFKIMCIVLTLVIVFLLTDAKLRPVIYDLAVVEAEAVASRTINAAVENSLAKSGVGYSDIISISRDENGRITGITTDIVKLNLFKSQVTNAVDSAFASKGYAEVSVALGSATGITFFSGCGPYADVKIGMLSSTSSDFENIFQSAGINQTQHSVMLNLETQVVFTFSGRRIISNIRTSFCVAQTVIVGSVPDVMVE